MKNYFIRLAFSLMTMVILYGVFYMVDLHTKTFAPFIILPLGIAGGYGACMFIK